MYHNMDDLKLNNCIHSCNSYKCEIKFSLGIIPTNTKRKAMIPASETARNHFLLIWLRNYELPMPLLAYHMNLYYIIMFFQRKTQLTMTLF